MFTQSVNGVFELVPKHLQDPKGLPNEKFGPKHSLQ